jgi:HSP20 family protein
MKEMIRSPWQEIRRLRNEIDRTFNQFFSEAKTELPILLKEQTPMTDIYETSEDVIVVTDIPGVNKEDIDIKITEANITIKAEARKEEEIEEEDYFIRERGQVKLYRRMPLPKKVKTKKAKATYSNGTLRIKLPKTEPEKEKEAVSLKVE